MRFKSKSEIQIEPLSVWLSVCKVCDYTKVDLDADYVFTGKTDEEKSLVCPTALVPDKTTDRDDGWKAFQIVGTMELSLVGILAGTADVMAKNLIDIFAISTFNTDYVLVKESDFEKAAEVLKTAGYRMLEMKTE